MRTQVKSTIAVGTALWAVLLFCLGGRTPLWAQAAQTAEKQITTQREGLVLRSETNVVLVDVRVWDKDGKPVGDLRPEEFRVYEERAEQKISSFSFENVERLLQAEAESGPPPTIDLGRIPPTAPVGELLRDRRLMVLFFDLTSLQVDDLMRALDSARAFVSKQMSPADLIAVVTYAYRLQVVQNFTNDRDALDRALKAIQPGETGSLSEMAAQGAGGTTGAGGQEVVAQDVSAAFTPDESEFNIFNTDQKLAAIESLSRLLRDVPGRKSVLHFSSGVERTGIENQAQLRATVDAANQANVSLYAVDSRGLVALPPGGAASAASPGGTAVYTGRAAFSQADSLQGGRETLASLAADTGGKAFFDLNNFAPVFRQIEADHSSYYLLGYSPTNLKADGRYRRIRVEVSRPGVKVQARPGYFAPKNFRQFSQEDKELQLLQAMELDSPFLDLPLVVEASHFLQPDRSYYVVLAAKIAGSSLPFAQKGTSYRTEFDFAWRALDKSDRPAGLLRDTLPVRVSGETYQQLQSSNILYVGGMVLSPGQYTLKVVARENQSGKLGTFEQPLSLPEVKDTSLALSSVVLSNESRESLGEKKSLARGGGSTPDPLRLGGRSLLPSVTRVFRNDQKMAVYLEAYRNKSQSSAKDEQTALPSAAPSFALVFFRGQMKLSEAGPFAGKLEKKSGERATFFVEIPLEKFPTGRYLMQVNVLDPAVSRAGFARVPLAIVKAPTQVATADVGK